jgi:hypothetical protein
MRVSKVTPSLCLSTHSCLQAQDAPIHYSRGYRPALAAHPWYCFPDRRIKCVGTTSSPSSGTTQQLPLDGWVSHNNLCAGHSGTD